jgi:Ca2+-binding EF-hand superfamily protein
MSMKMLSALFMEIDENVNGKVEVDEFIGMVAKLRGRCEMSPEFHLRSLPRAVKDSYVKLFDQLADESRLMEREDLIASCKKLHSHVNTSSEVFKQALDDLTAIDNRYCETDFLLFQAKLRKPKPEIDVALISLTPEEEERFGSIFAEWRSKSQNNCSAQELRIVLGQLGFNLSAEQCRNRMGSLDLDGSRPIQLNEFLYLLVNLGLGSSEKHRSILLPGSSYEEGFSKGFSLTEMWELGYDDLAQIKRAGWSVHHVVAAGFAEPWELRQVGYTAGELRKAGLSVTQLKLAGFSLEDLRNAGFSSAALRECCSDLGRQRAMKAPEGPGLALRPVTMADRPQTGNNGEQRWWGTPRIQAMLQPDQNNESIMSIMSW